MGVTFTFSTFTIFYGYKLYYIKLSMIFPFFLSIKNRPTGSGTISWELENTQNFNRFLFLK